MTSPRFMYVFNKTQRVGVITFSVNKENKIISYQYSSLHKQDKFDATKGKMIALERLVSNPFLVEMKNENMNAHEIVRKVMKKLSKKKEPNKMAPTKIVKFARSWLNKTTKKSLIKQ